MAFRPRQRTAADGELPRHSEDLGGGDGSELRTLSGRGGAVWSVEFSPDGAWLAMARDYRTVLYDTRIVYLDELVELAHERVTRELRPDECLQYFGTETCPPLP